MTSAVPPQTGEYAPGRAVDLYRGAGAGYVLLWHGRGPNERDALRHLAGRVAAQGPTVIAPDWDSAAPDEGRADLLASLAFARAAADDRLVLAGWSRGASIACAVTIAPEAVGGWRADAVVCLAGGFIRREPITGLAPDAHADRWPLAVPVRLVHGVDDEVVPVERSRAFAAKLREAGADAHYEEIPTNHAGVVMARYDRGLRRCVPAEEPNEGEGAEASVRAILESAGRSHA